MATPRYTTHFITSDNSDCGTQFLDKDYMISVYPELIPSGKLPGLWAWGPDAYGQLGDLSHTNKSSPIQIGSLTTWKQISSGFKHSGAIKTDGTLWLWGGDGTGNPVGRGNAYGQLGFGDTVDRISPTQLGSLTDWSYSRNITTDVAGVRLYQYVLPIENGGTGQGTATAALLALMPPYTGPTKYVLTTNGQDVYWAPIASLP